MGTVEVAAQSAALPPINCLDIEKIRRDEAADYRGKQTAPVANSPTVPHHPPESPARPTATTTNGYTSPADSRRTSGEDDEPIQPPRQSLPSIHEALGGEQAFQYPSASSGPKIGTVPYSQAPTPISASEPARRPFVESAPQETPQQATRSPYISHQPTSIPPTSQSANSQVDTQDRGGFAKAHNPKLPTLHPLQTSHSSTDQSRHPAQPYTHHQSQQSSPVYDQASRSAGSMNPPTFGYTAYPAQPSFTNANAGPAPSYATQTSYPATPPAHFPPSWRGDEPESVRVGDSKRMRLTGSSFGESVKRRLETFDVETSLTEIKDRAIHMLAFADRYSRPTHHSSDHRIGPNTLPTISEIDDFTHATRQMQDSFIRIRDVVLAQQTSLAAEQAQANRFKATNRFDADELHRQREQAHQQQQHPSYVDEHKSGNFGSGDPKKRRARAAPPGRCHSCKRSETPEWRRGPDGARTLCNACGLHYAKLTKKMGTDKATLGSSNLRPKNMGATADPI